MADIFCIAHIVWHRNFIIDKLRVEIVAL